MGSYKSKGIKNQITEPPVEQPEPDYAIRTRSPKPSLNWSKNVLRGKREDDLRDEAMPIARKKCYHPINEYRACTLREGVFWSVFNCQEVYSHTSACLVHEFQVEMDKRRRDVQRYPESWWREYYSSEGEVGEQAAWRPEQDFLLQFLRRPFSK